jgi:putative membrane protein
MVIAAFALIAIAYLSEGTLVELSGEGMGEQFLPALFAAIVLAVANATVKPILKLLALPLRIMTLGLFSLVISALMVYFAHWVVEGFEVAGFWQAIVVAVIMAVVNSVATRALEDD